MVVMNKISLSSFENPGILLAYNNEDIIPLYVDEYINLVELSLYYIEVCRSVNMEIDILELSIEEIEKIMSEYTVDIDRYRYLLKGKGEH